MLNKVSRRNSWQAMMVLAVFGLAVVGLLANVPVAGAKEKTLKILGTMPMTGPAAFYGGGFDKGVKLAVEEINKKGVKGFPGGIEYRVVDTQSKPSLMARKLKREVPSWKPNIIVGAALEPTARVWCADLPKYKIPGIVCSFLSLSKYRPPGEVPVSRWVHYFGFADYFGGQLVGKFFHDKGAKRVAYIGGDYDWGYSNSMGLKSYWERNGRPFEIVKVIYTALDKTDYTTEVQILKDAKPDAIFSVYGGAGWFTLAKQLKEAGAMPKIFVYGLGYPNMGSAKLTGEYGAEGIYGVQTHDPTTDAWKAFIRRWRDKYGEQAYPEPYSNNMYDIVYWAVKGLEAVGPDKIDDKDYVCDTLMKTSYQGLAASPMGPLGPYGSNWGCKAVLVQYVKGAGELDPNFGLHPEVRAVLATPKMDIKQILDDIGGLTRLERGERYPMGQ